MTKFKRIVIFGRWRGGNDVIQETLTNMVNFLIKENITALLEEETAESFNSQALPTINRHQLKGQCDLIIVIGGDGSLLSAAQAAVEADVPVLGINRGRLGFLTDILPSELETKVGEVLSGKYLEEKRFFLSPTLYSDRQQKLNDVLNDVVLHPGDTPHMIEFTTSIDGQTMCKQRADGLIISTPTGSTAYALSGGGPILHPQLDAIVMVPMFPHTLSNRPIVISGNSEICLTLSEQNETTPRIICDGQTRIPFKPGDKLIIKKKPEALRLIHTLDYNYYETLRVKLGWR